MKPTSFSSWVVHVEDNMNKIKNIFELLCQTVIVAGMAGLLLCGYERVIRMGVIPVIVVFVLTPVLLAYKGKKEENDSDE